MTLGTLIRVHINQLLKYVNGTEKPKKRKTKEFKDVATAQVREQDYLEY
jgi:hypothetical protein